MIVAGDAAHWSGLFELPLSQRLGPAQPEVTDHVSMVNQALGVPQRPVPAVVPDDFLVDVRGAIGELPAVVRDLLDEVLLGVYFTRQLGSSAITDIVVSDAGRILGVVVALDFDAFEHRTANEWASWKENTPFSAGDGDADSAGPHFRLTARIEDAAGDNRKNALQYLLLHEFGHVLTALRGFIPDWWADPQTLQGGDAYSYLPLAWRFDTNRQIVPLPHNDFALRRQVVYYHGAQLGAADMEQVYRQLDTTCFATLYAAVNVYEDFAESFATYVHSVLLHKPAEIRIWRDGELLLRRDGYWTSPASAQKHAFLASFLGTTA